jgi:amino acid adenylation domain-containing protein/non-ribosomal peptide synthase protein (TIGR01720 family)
VLNARGRSALSALAADALGQCTVVMAMLGWTLARFFGRGPVCLAVPPLDGDEGPAQGVLLAPALDVTVRAWLADVLSRHEAALDGDAVAADLTDCWVLDARVHDTRLGPLPRHAALCVHTEHVPEGTLTLWYDTARCDADVMERFAEQLSQAFDLLVDREARLGDWPRLSAAERDQLQAWGVGDAPMADVPRLERPVHESIAEVMQRTPDAPAVRCGDVTWSYAALDAAATAVARSITAVVTPTPTVAAGHASDGSARDEVAPIALCMARGPWLIAAMLGVLRSGHAYLPLDPNTPVVRLGQILSDARVPLVLTDAAQADVFGETGYPLLVTDDHLLTRQHAGEHEGRPVSLHAPAYVIYTSGSTGTPKGCILEHRHLAHYLTWATRYYWGGRPATMALFTSVAFDMPVTTIFAPMLTGGTLVILPETLGADDALRAQFVPGAGIDTVKLTPSHIVMLEALSIARTDVQLAIVGGEAMTPAHLAVLRRLAPGMRVVNEYGPTEATVGCIVDDLVEDGAVTIGRPISRMDAWVLDAAGALLPPGVRGELCVGGDGVARGYLHNPALTAEKFLPHPVLPGRKLYRTGDEARWRRDGRLECFGRLDGQVKIRGHRIELGEVESALRALPGVRDACALVEVPAGAQQEAALVAAVVADAMGPGAPAPGHPAVADPLVWRRALRERLPAAMIPSRIVVVAQLPLNSNGKVDRRQVQAVMAAAPGRAGSPAGDATDSTVPLHGAIEQTLAALYSRVLRTPVESADADFVALGGHSLRAMELLAAIHDAFGGDVPLAAVFEARTLRALATQLRAARPADRPRLEPGPEAPHHPLSHEQRRLWVLDQLEANRAVYNIVAPVLLEGPLDVPRLAHALDAVSRRHETLRTQLLLVDGEPRQRVVPVPYAALQVHTEILATDALDDWIVRDAVTPLDLLDGPLWRASLLPVQGGRHVLVVTQHHIITDEQSARQLVSDLLTAYATGAELPALPVQYRDYVRWQQRYLRSAAAQADRAFWQSTLAAVAPPLSLPTDRARPAVRTNAGARVRQQVTASQRRALEGLAQARHTSPYRAWLALVQVMLRAYSGQERVWIGTPVSGRHDPALREQVGLFVNTVVLAATIAETSTFMRCVDEAHRVATDAFAHATYPFDRLLDELEVPRDPARSPLFEVLLTYEDAAAEAPQSTGLHLHDVMVDVPLAKFDLTVGVKEQADGSAVVELEYNRDLFDHTRTQAMLAALGEMLTTLTAAPDVPLVAFPWWAEVARDRAACAAARTGNAQDPGAVHATGDVMAGIGAPAEGQSAGQTAERTEGLEADLGRLWQSVLQVDTVQPDDDFFALGGDSILALQVVARARARQLPVSVRQLFEHPTIRRLALVVQQGRLAPMARPLAQGGLTPMQAQFLETYAPAGVLSGTPASHYNQSVLLDLPRDVDASRVARAVAAVLHHHDALRMRFLHTGETWRQESTGTAPTVEQWHVADADALTHACDALQRSLDPVHGPVVRAVLFMVQADAVPRIFLLAHHLVIDGVSWRVLLDDLALAWQAPDAALPPASFSMSEYAAAVAQWVRREGTHQSAYWLQAVGTPDQWPREWAPADASGGPQPTSASAVLDAETTRRLLSEAGRAYGTDVQDVLLAAVLRALAHTTAQRQFVVELEHHGRTALSGVDLTRSVGWFTARYPVRFAVPAHDTEASWLVTTKETLRTVPDKGVGCDALRQYAPDESVRDRLGRSGAAVQFNYLGRADAAVSLPGWSLSSLPTGDSVDSNHPRRQLLEITALVQDGCCDVAFGYDASQLEPARVDALAATFADEVRALVAHATAPGNGTLTPSEVPASRLDAATLSAVLATVPGTGTARDLVEDVLACTPLQEGLLYHHLRGIDGDAYHEQWVFTLRGALDVPSFRAAWDEVIARHAALRTVFRWRDVPHPVQIVLRTGLLEWTVASHRVADAEALAAHARTAMAADRARPFDVAAGPLQRLHVLQGAGECTIVCWSHHHLVLDGWSTQLVIRDVIAAYHALRRGVSVPSHRGGTFRAYVEWQATRDPTRLRDYWSAMLEDIEAPTLLPAQRVPEALPPASPSVAVPDRMRYTRVLATEVTACLLAELRRQRLTLSTLARAAWALVLAAHADRDDVVFGVTLAGRPPELPDIDLAVGLYIVTVPFRVRVDRGRRVGAWLRTLHQQQAELDGMAAYPAAAIERCSGVSRERPLFESLVVVENYPLRESTETPGDLHICGLDVRSYSHYPLALTVIPGTTCELSLDVDPARIDPVAAEAVLEQVVAQLQRLAADSAATVSALLPSRLADVVEVALADRTCAAVSRAAASGTDPAWLQAAAARALALRYGGHEELRIGAACPVGVDLSVFPSLPLCDVSAEIGRATDEFPRAVWPTLIAPLPAPSAERVLWDLRVVVPAAAGTVILASDSGRFDADDLRRAGAHFEMLLMAACEAAGTVETAPLLTDAEQAQLAAWNATTTTYEGPDTLTALVVDGLAAIRRVHPDQVVVRVPAESRDWTAEAFDRRTTRLARVLQARGVGRDVLVGVCAERSSAMIVSLVAILKAGGAYVPLDPTLPPERLAYQLTDSGVALVLAQAAQPTVADALVAALNAVDGAPPEILWITAGADDADAMERLADDAPFAVDVARDDLAYMIYTSGSTGRPKGALNTQGGVANRLHWMQAAYPLSATDRILQKTPYSFDVSVWELFWPFLSGARLVFAVPGGHTDSEYLAETMRAEGITMVHFVPSMLQAFVQDPLAAIVAPTYGGTLRHVVLSGEALSAAVVARTQRAIPGVALHNLYGPTEAAVDVSAWTCPPLRAGDVVPIGAPMANTQLHVLDAAGQPVPPGITGTLWIGGVQVGRGYHRRPELTAERFRPDPWRDGGQLYRTGDLARWRRHGVLEYLGREDHQVKLHGHRIELGEIEAVLSAVAGVAAAAVVVADGAAGQPVLVAHLEAAPTSDPRTRDALAQSACARRLPVYMVPKSLQWWPALPRLSNGKLDRRALEGRVGEVTSAHAVTGPGAASAPAGSAERAVTSASPTSSAAVLAEAPRDAIERQLHVLWSDVLRVEPIGRHETFFDLGGDSLLAVRLASRMESTFGVPVPIATLLAQASIATLAEQLRAGGTEAAWTPLVRLSGSGTGAPLFLFPGAGGNVLAFEPLARRLAGTRPLYALQAVGLDGRTPPYTDVPSMAAAAVPAIEAAAGTSPVLLAGHSFGGALAFEAAQQLRARGTPVAWVGMLDTPAPVFAPEAYTAQWSEVDWVRRLARDIESMTGASLALEAALDATRVAPHDAEGAFAALVECLVASGWWPASAPRRALAGYLAVYRANLTTHYQVQTAVHDVPVTLFTAADQDIAHSTTAVRAVQAQHGWGWTQLAERVTVVPVPGDHLGMLTEPHVTALAAAVHAALASIS